MLDPSQPLEQETGLFMTKCDSYIITKCDKCYYKVRQFYYKVLQVLQIAMISATEQAVPDQFRLNLKSKKKSDAPTNL